jgi:hypothetical protein
MALGREVFGEQFGHTHLQEKGADDQNIVCALVGAGDVFAHSTSLAQFLIFSRKFARTVRQNFRSPNGQASATV